MATFSSVTRQHVLRALAEHDERGGEEFLALYGFGPSGGTLTHEGGTYDARAVLAVAHRYATGRLATVEEFHGPQAVEILRRRGFEVTGPPPPPRRAAPTASAGSTLRTPRAPRAARSRPATVATSARAAAAREERLAICPTCSMALPATGVCDSCG